jgi:hypothetical protein
MKTEAPKRRRSSTCLRKRRYDSYYSAERALERIAIIFEREDDGLHPYFCYFCRGIHLGHAYAPRETIIRR